MNAEKLISIGIQLNSLAKISKKNIFDIEDVLIEAIQNFETDHRLMSLVFSWIQIHGNYVVIEKLAKKLKMIDDAKTKIYLTAVAAFAIENGYYKWKKIITKFKTNEYLIDEDISKSAIQFKGEIVWLKKYRILAPNDCLRIREDDILDQKKLAKKNKQYKNRLLYGPSFRADIITAIENGAKTPIEITKIVGCSYEPAYRVFFEYNLAKAA